MAHLIETAESKVERVKREAEIIAQAHADIDAGLGIGDDELEAWLDELDVNPDAPLPSPGALAARPR
jgi:hypothetical protein